MGKATYTSKGEVGINKTLKNQQRRDHVENGSRALAQLAAWKQGKNVVLTIANPNTNETNKPFIRVPATQVWGSPHYHKKTNSK